LLQVSISPEVISKKVSRDIIDQLVTLNNSHLGKRTPAYDGRKSLYTAGPLPFQSKDFVVKVGDDRVSSSAPVRYFSLWSVCLCLSVRVYLIFVILFFHFSFYLNAFSPSNVQKGASVQSDNQVRF
jgi:hypothetical protein